MQITKITYVIGLLIIFASVFSQYIFGSFGLILGLLIVYGIPVLATILLGGTSIIKKAFNHSYTALKFGFGYFGAFTVLGIVAGVIILLIIVQFNPNAANLLNTPNPLLQVSPELAWIMVAVSILIVGPAEEYLFRGFVYGGLLVLSKNRHWLTLALASSISFAIVHVYYAITYEITSLILFTDIVMFGMSMSATYYVSGGNLLVPSIIHGVYDAFGYIGVATSLEIGLFLRGGMLAVGTIVALILLFQRSMKKSSEVRTTLEPPKFCIYCGQRLFPDAKFCPRCGRPIQVI